MLTAVLLTENAIFNTWQQVTTVLVMLSVLILTCILMILSGWINRIIGGSGAIVISRVMGLVLSSVATTNILAGISEYFNLSS